MGAKADRAAEKAEVDEKSFVAKLAAAIAVANGHPAPEEWSKAVAEAYVSLPAEPADSDDSAT